MGFLSPNSSDDISYHQLCDRANPYRGFFRIHYKTARRSIIRADIKSRKAAQIDRSCCSMCVSANYTRYLFRIEPQLFAHTSVAQIRSEEGSNRWVLRI